MIKRTARIRATVLTLAIVAALGLSFAGCSSDDAAPSITVNSASGNGVSLSGTWSRCFFEGPNDRQETQTFSGTTFTVEDFSWSSTTGVCTGTSTLTEQLTVSMTSVGDIVTTGWADSNTIVGPPAALGGGNLADPVTGTGIEFVITSAGGGGDKAILFIDDSDPAAAPRMYSSTSLVIAGCGANAAGFVLCLDVRSPAVRQ